MTPKDNILKSLELMIKILNLLSFFISEQYISQNESFDKLSEIQLLLLELYKNFNNNITPNPSLKDSNINPMDILKISILIASNAEMISELSIRTMKAIYDTDYEQYFPKRNLLKLKKYLDSLNFFFSHYSQFPEGITQSILMLENILRNGELPSEKMDELNEHVSTMASSIKQVHSTIFNPFFNSSKIQNSNYDKIFWDFPDFSIDNINSFLKNLLFRFQILTVLADNQMFDKDQLNDFFNKAFIHLSTKLQYHYNSNAYKY